jgi:hypothetical protein
MLYSTAAEVAKWIRESKKATAAASSVRLHGASSGSAQGGEDSESADGSGVMWMEMNLIVRNGSELAATTQMTTHSFRRGLDNGMMNVSSVRMGGV